MTTHFRLAIALAYACTAIAAAQPTSPTAPTPAQPSPKQAKAPIYDESADARAQIAAALAKAKKENRRVLIQWGANWCHWCHLLHDGFKSRDKVGQNDFTKRPENIASKLRAEYDLVLVDVERLRATPHQSWLAPVPVTRLYRLHCHLIQSLGKTSWA